MKQRANAALAGGLCVAILGMVGVSFAAVPLYRLFCQATGYNGTPVIGPGASPGVVGEKIQVQFDANVNSALPWTFAPDNRIVSVALGDEVLATYHAENRGGRPITGVATYNVMPDKAARYFHKTACFCFDQQTLVPGQAMSFPLSFWVDPAIALDPETRDVHTITLSYTFFRSLKDAVQDGDFSRSGPHVGPRADAGRAADLASLSR